MESLLELPADEMAEAGELPADLADYYRGKASRFDARAELEQASRLGVRLIDFEDPEYPDLLKSIPDFPLLLYIRGELRKDALTVAFVGSRRPTYYGRRMTQALAAEAVAGGLTVVSGLARGIDTEAHKAALGARDPSRAPTWAVLGSGLGRIYPSENEALSRDIVEAGGCLISEYPLLCAPLKANFPRRNRIIAGLSWGSVVVEGEVNSGSLITAKFALEYGRQVFGVPGPADSSLSDAPHKMIKSGAKLAAKIEDIFDELPPGCRPMMPKAIPEGQQGVASPAATLSIEQTKILQCLKSEAWSLEQVGNALGIDLPRLSGILCDMELQDLVVSLPGQRYAKKRN
ncbi:MAG: DNA protecting protein DprA [Elusimicrobia bacterium RIFCSPHIGHO2_02_FULL_57_9]|nr:MAG: DNA protecting protein DprA [Elusimicrobia bacterium RIFCSPHIGHO2_02_FULL_57_9]